MDIGWGVGVEVIALVGVRTGVSVAIMTCVDGGCVETTSAGKLVEAEGLQAPSIIIKMTTPRKSCFIVDVFIFSYSHFVPSMNKDVRSLPHLT
jgi:hypothetical protein